MSVAGVLAPFFSFIFLVLGQFLFRIVLVVLSWAINIFLGRLRGRRMYYLYTFAGLSVFWVYLIAAGFFPGVKDLFAYIPDRTLGNILKVFFSTAGILLIPAAVGALSLMFNREENRDYLRAAGRGFIYCLFISGGIFLMLVLAPVIMLRRIIKKETALYVPLSIKPGRMDTVREKLRRGLSREFEDVKIAACPGIYRLPNKMLENILHTARRSDIIEGDGFRIFMNHQDIMIEARGDIADNVKIHTAEILDWDMDSYLTTGETGRRLEDRIHRLWERYRAGQTDPEAARADTDEIMAELYRGQVLYCEWEILTRALLAFKAVINKDLGDRHED